MSRNTDKNIKAHNDKLHKAQDKAKAKKAAREEKLKAMVRKFNEQKEQFSMTNCYCGSSDTFENCCEIYIKGIQKPATAEA